MQRHFISLAILTVLLTLAVGGGGYGLSRSAILQARQHATQATVMGIASNLSAQTALLQQLVKTLAQSSAVMAALSSADPAKLKEVAEQLQHYLPAALKVRLILPESPDPLKQSKPDLSFADLDMARASFVGDPLPAVHELGSNQHLAITAKTVKNGVVIGVILVSFSTQTIKQGFQQTTLNEGYWRLMQDALPLFEQGNASLKNEASESFNIAHTAWRLDYAPATMADSSLSTWMLVMMAVAFVLTILWFLKGYRTFEALFIGDRGMILTAMKDLVNRRMHDTYPMSFKEMAFIVETLYALNQTFKRDTQGMAIDFPDETPYHFTEESDDFFLTTAPAVAVSAPIDIAEASRHAAILSPIDFVASSTNSTLDAIFNPGVIRGIVDKHLNTTIFHDLGCAVGSELQTDGVSKIVLGYDGRISSPAFAEAFAQGVITTGCQVIDIGLVPISLMYDVALEVTDKFGVMITGGHSPGHINGLKLLIQGEPATDKYLHTLKKRMLFEDYAIKTGGYIEKATRYSSEYLDKIAQDILLIKPLKVVIDCGNGVTSLFAPNLFTSLGCEVFELFCEIEGEFPHHLPDPSKTENLSDLMAAVVHYQADIGIAFDGDGDRLGVVDSAGRVISPEWLIQLFAKHILQAYPCTSIVYDDKCGKQLDDYIVQLGGNALPCKSGQLLSQLKVNHSLFAGDLSGRMIFNDRWMGLDDALYAAARLLEILSAEINGSKAMFNALSYDVKKT